MLTILFKGMFDSIMKDILSAAPDVRSVGFMVECVIGGGL